MKKKEATLTVSSTLHMFSLLSAFLILVFVFVYSRSAVFVTIFLFVISLTRVYQHFREFSLIIAISFSLISSLFSPLHRSFVLLAYCEKISTHCRCVAFTRRFSLLALIPVILSARLTKSLS